MSDRGYEGMDVSPGGTGDTMTCEVFQVFAPGSGVGDLRG